MSKPRFLAFALLLSAAPSFAAVQLTPVVSGLTSPVFVTTAHDATGRLFIVEKAGRIKVLQPGSVTPTVFLDIHTKVVASGEQGLLGLAFHPGYPVDPRFYVYYTRSAPAPTDYELVIAQYAVSADPDVASAAETPILVIAHPDNTNHNGGMLAFGPDGYLYTGTGDGGSGNDPPNNAQNIDVLLGKLLRIDVDHPNGQVPYSSPPSNPFFGATKGADEIFAYGLRNPWRWSFDRETGRLWVGDVGQDAREEVDTPIVSGGNYGWRVYEGFLCTNIDSTLCLPANYLFPILDYAHTGGRCAITGGYVYRGTAAVFPQGTYLYGDYCTGEIFTWNGSMPSLLTDTTLALSSFGEDEAGEHYVVDISGGSVARFTTTSCAYSLPVTHVWLASDGGPASVQLDATGGCAWRAVAVVPWISVTSGGSGTGNGTVMLSVASDAGAGRAGAVGIGGRLFTVHQTSVEDVLALINFLFAGGPIPPQVRDVNGDLAVDVLDVFYLINFLFAGGPPPP
jgi:hypothetical protein